MSKLHALINPDMMFPRRPEEEKMDALIARGRFIEDRSNPNAFDDRLSAAMRSHPHLLMDLAAVELLVEKYIDTEIAYEIGHSAMDLILLQSN